MNEIVQDAKWQKTLWTHNRRWPTYRKSPALTSANRRLSYSGLQRLARCLLLRGAAVWE